MDRNNINHFSNDTNVYLVIKVEPHSYILLVNLKLKSHKKHWQHFPEHIITLCCTVEDEEQ